MIIFVKFFYFLADKQPKLAYFLGKLIITFTYFIGIRRHIIMKNLMIAFPEKDISWYRITAIKTYHFFAYQTIYSAHFYRHPQKFLKELSISNYDKYERINKKNKPIFFFTAHFGLWELTTLFFGIKGLKAAILYQKIHDKNINNFILKFRHMTSLTYILRNDIKSLLNFLKSGNNLGVLVDQRPREKGLEKKFFNKKVRFYYTPFKLVKKYNGHPLFVFLNSKNGKYFLNIIDNVGNTPEEILDNYIKNLEEHIRKYPEQYFWFHNRWKNAR